MGNRYYYYKNAQTAGNPQADNKTAKKGSKLVEFAYDTADPIVFAPVPNNLPLSNQPLTLATATLNNVKEGNVVWLNGLYHVDNDSAVVIDVITSIYRGSIAPSNLIYRSVIEVDAADASDDATFVSAQFVDSVLSTENDVTYYLTAQLGTAAIAFAYGPITFTAAEIKL